MKNKMDVGLDVWEYKPVKLSEVKKPMKYRIYVDVEGENADDATRKVKNEGLDWNITSYPYTDEETLTLLELARVALNDADIYQEMAELLDLADEELKTLQEKLHKDLEEWDSWK